MFLQFPQECMKRLLLTLALLCSTPFAAAQEAKNTLIIQQISPNGMLGEWTLIKPGNKRITLNKESYKFSNLPTGSYTLLISPPKGAIAEVRKMLGEDVIETKNHPQISFTLENNIEMELQIEYTFTRVGTVSVSSQPAGLEFSIVGPNDFFEEGVSPATYSNMPEGQYSVTFAPIPNCAKPPALSDRLIKDSRINFTIKISCDGIEATQQKQNENLTFQYVSTVINGKTIIFTDTPMSEWYANAVHTAVKTGVMSGYKNEAGQLTGEFGPGNNITLAELLKIAHELANIDEFSQSGRSKNEAARGTWFEKYAVSAEQLHWLVYQDSRLDFGRNATRAEVVVTLLQALEVPRLWARGDLFTDIQRSSLYASSIETAAEDGLVNGYEDGTFRPNAFMNRAEISKVISEAMQLYLDN